MLGGGWTSASIEAIGQAELRGAPVRRGGARGTWCRGTVCEGQRLPFRRWSMPTEGEGLQPLFRLFFSTPLLRFPILAPTVLPSLAVPVCPMLSTQWPHSYPQPALSTSTIEPPLYSPIHISCGRLVPSDWQHYLFMTIRQGSLISMSLGCSRFRQVVTIVRWFTYIGFLCYAKNCSNFDY